MSEPEHLEERSPNYSDRWGYHEKEADVDNHSSQTSHWKYVDNRSKTG